MRTAAEVVVGACWGAWALLWLVMALHTKRTAERAGGASTYVIVLAAVGGLWLVLGLAGARRDVNEQLWSVTPVVGAVAIALVVGGLVFTAWARVTLGTNWSGSVVVKEDHELVQRGPYAIVRHPIYTGLLAMVLGTALTIGQPQGLYAFALVALALWIKSRREETVMTRTFPDAYPAYRRRVRAIIPYVL